MHNKEVFGQVMSTDKLDLDKIQDRAKSPWVKVTNSEIHGSGVFAAKKIPKETRIMEYLGEHIDKEESERRALAQMAKAEETGEAGVYIFTLDDDWDIDGNFEWNTARLINHSCAPNCETWIEEDQIFVYALRDIKKGEELVFNYGFGVDTYEDHPCRCGTDRCIGYIVCEEEWPKLKKILKKNKKK